MNAFYQEHGRWPTESDWLEKLWMDAHPGADWVGNYNERMAAVRGLLEGQGIEGLAYKVAAFSGSVGWAMTETGWNWLNDLLGVLAGHLGGGKARYEVHKGELVIVWEKVGGPTAWVMEGPFNAEALTLGHNVLARQEVPLGSELHRHEIGGHVEDYDVLGPFFLPLYAAGEASGHVLQKIFQTKVGGHALNPLEVTANLRAGLPPLYPSGGWWPW